MKKQKILVIKLSALGDFIHAASTLVAIRNHYGNDAHITFLTTPPYQDIANKLGVFNEIWTNGRCRSLSDLWHLRNKIIAENFDLVFDLQGVDRTKFIFWAIWPKQPQWVGTAWGCKYHYSGNYHQTHPRIRYEKMLKMVDINHTPTLNLKSLAAFSKINPPEKPYAIIVAGASKPEKCWPVDRYIKICAYLKGKGVTPVIVGTSHDGLTELQGGEGIIDLVDRTNIYDIIQLANLAVVSIGNDTGPQLIAASGGCPTITLHLTKNPPDICGAYGESALSICKDVITDITLEEVIDCLHL